MSIVVALKMIASQICISIDESLRRRISRICRKQLPIIDKIAKIKTITAKVIKIGFERIDSIFEFGGGDEINLEEEFVVVRNNIDAFVEFIERFEFKSVEFIVTV